MPQHLLCYRPQAYRLIAPNISSDIDHGNAPIPYAVYTISPLIMYMTTQYEVNVKRNIEGMGKPAWVFPRRPMPHEYLHPAYAAADEVAGISQSVIMISLQEDCLTTNHTHGITTNPHRVAGITSSCKTEVTQMIHRIMSRDHPIPIPYQPAIHFSSISERWIPVNIPNDVLVVQM